MIKYTRNFILTIILFCITNYAYSFEIVYPKNSNVIINSDVTFFIGNENPDKGLKINGENVKIHSSGGFYHVVKLRDGENIFNISNGIESENKIYSITKPKTSSAKIKDSNYIAFNSPVVYVTIADNIPLRATPIAEGVNRLQHLNQGIPLCIIGEVDNFYKVQLARDDYAWIEKSHVKAASPDYDNSPANIESYTYTEDKDSQIYSIKLSKKTPYILSETRVYNLTDGHYLPHSEGLDLSIYNVHGFPENTYNFHINNTDTMFGYKTFFLDSGELQIEVKKFPNISNSKPLNNIKITLDPGHGGKELGAIGCLGNNEKDINLAIAIKTKKILETKGAKVYLTRDTDKYMSLYDRIAFSQDNNTDVFISIHANALPDSLAESNRTGTSIYYFYPQSNMLANAVLDSMVKELSMKNDKVRQESFAVIRNSQSLSILIEVGYMINPEDNAKLVSPDFQEQAAQAIVHGLENFFNENKK